MYKIVYNGMYEYKIIKICSKYDITMNTIAFVIMHCVLFAANELNNTPNSSRRVGGEVVFFPRASDRRRLACRMPSHRSMAVPPPSAPLLTSYTSRRMLSALSNVVIVDECCSVAVVELSTEAANTSSPCCRELVLVL